MIFGVQRENLEFGERDGQLRIIFGVQGGLGNITHPDRRCVLMMVVCLIRDFVT